MNKNVLVGSFAGLCTGVAVLLSGSSLDAASVSAPAAIDACSKELLLAYFPETFVNDTLKRFNIAEDKWAGINASLASTDKEIIKLVEEKAASMTPNPLKDPQQRQAAVKLFRETLLQVFTDALKSNGIEDSSQFQAMLDDIQQQKAKKFAQCMEKQREQQQRGRGQIAGNNGDSENKTIDSDDDGDQDDSDDDEEDDDNDHEEDDRHGDQRGE